MVAAGDALVSPGSRAARREGPADDGRLVARGLSNQEIAARLVLSPLTAKTHVSRAAGDP